MQVDDSERQGGRTRPRRRVFVSAPDVDTPPAADLVDALRAAGAEVEHSPTAGDDPRFDHWYDVDLPAAVARADAFVIVPVTWWDSSTWMGTEAVAGIRRVGEAGFALYAWTPAGVDPPPGARGLWLYLERAIALPHDAAAAAAAIMAPGDRTHPAVGEPIVAEDILTSFAGVETAASAPYTFFFYGAERLLPFATLAAADSEFDRVSALDRPGVYRLNIGVSPETYRSLFGPEKPRLGPEGRLESGDDFTQLDRLLPHPFYAPQSWVCILNPGYDTYAEVVRPLLQEAYDRAVQRARRRSGEGPPA